MSAKTARGTKRKCQNEECGASFYDLERETFECPMCGTEFDHEAAARASEPQPSRYPARKQPRNLPIVASEEPDAATDDSSDEDLLVSEGDDSDDDDSSSETSDVLLDDEPDENLGDTLEIPKTKDEDDT